MKKWITLKEEIKYRAKIFNYVQLQRKSPKSGKEGQFDRLDCNDWVNVVARTEQGNFVLVHQYRHGSDSVTDEIPGGAIDPGEDPLVAAKRELLEETGYEAESWQALGVMEPNPAILNNKCFVFFADKAKKVAEQNLDNFEEIEILEESYETIKEKIKSGEIAHSLVLAAFYYFDRMSN